MKDTKKIKTTSLKTNAGKLFNEICLLVDNSKVTITVAVNHQLTKLNWQIVYILQHDILKSKRAITQSRLFRHSHNFYLRNMAEDLVNRNYGIVSTL